MPGMSFSISRSFYCVPLLPSPASRSGSLSLTSPPSYFLQKAGRGATGELLVQTCWSNPLAKHNGHSIFWSNILYDTGQKAGHPNAHCAALLKWVTGLLFSRTARR